MDAVLFDMDGVLVDSERYWVARETDEIFPATVAGSVDPAETTGMNVEDLYTHLDAEHGTLVDEAAFVSTYDDHAGEIYGDLVDLLDEFEETVGLLAERGVAVGLVSSSPVRWIDLVLDRFVLHDVFETVVSAEHVERGKPAPDVYLHAASLLDVDPADCVAVEDSAHGLRAADRAGMTTVGFAREGGDQPPAVRDAADATAADPAALRVELVARLPAPG